MGLLVPSNFISAITNNNEVPVSPLISSISNRQLIGNKITLSALKDKESLIT